MAGDPSLAVTESLVLELENAGADLIELGVPFSDPIADGPVIQKAAERALRSGTSLQSILALVKTLRAKTQIPLILMTYYNTIMAMGEEEFCSQAVHAGVDGVIVPDMPPEESDVLCQASAKVWWTGGRVSLGTYQYKTSAKGGKQSYRRFHLLCFDHRDYRGSIE